MPQPHPHPFTAHWRARWIWATPPAIHPEVATRPVLSDPRDRIVLLRRTLELDTVPDQVPCRLWVDGRYRMSVNGVEVARGPVRADPRRARYDLVDLAPHLAPGANVVAVTARHYGTATSWWIPVPPTYSLGAGSLVWEALVGDTWVVSDSRWRARVGDAWTPLARGGELASLPLESFDSRVHPHGWDRPGFDDSAWETATEIVPFHTGAHGDPHPPSEPYGLLRPPVRTAFPAGAHHRASEVRRRWVAGTATQPDPVDQVLADETSGEVSGADTAGTPAGTVQVWDLDLGRVAAGTVELAVADAPAGTTIDVAAGEHLGSDGRLVPLGQHAGLRYVCAGGSESFSSFDVIGARHLHLSVRSPHGLPDAGAAGAVHLDVGITDRYRPRPPGAGFACSDPVLERIYEVGLRTVDLCALDAYVDCPTREQRAWTGDAVVHQQVDLVTNPDWSMARWHPQLAATPRPDGMLPMCAAADFTADDRTFIPDWALHWVRSVRNLARYTGDWDLVAELLPVAERVLRWFEAYRGADGLLHEVTGWVLIDWSSVYTAGCSSALNALWARGLEDLADLAGALGNAGTQAWARSRFEGVRGGFEVFWDPSRDLYVDHTLDGVPQRVAAQHGGAAALAAGLVPPERVGAVVDRLVDRSRLIRHSWVMDSVTPTGGSAGFIHLVTGYPPPIWDVEDQMVEAQPFFRSVLHEGLARAGRSDLIAGLCRDWSVFLDAGETTWPECWVGGTRCHGWSSTPSHDLVVHTVGISPAEAGYARVRVAPALGDLEWARATVPTPHGPVTVEAHSDGRVEVDSPVPVVRV